MTHVGFGVLVDGKPAGVWPLSRGVCEGSAAHYRRDKPKAKVEIVSVYADLPTEARSATPMMGGKSA